MLGGKYEVEHVLGEGGMGIVVAAKHLQLGHRVAIKMMFANGLRNADALARFEREARAAAELSSEHVARVTDVGHFDNGAPFMVMEYLEGEDLAARIEREGPLPVADVVRMFIQACIGLGDAHEHGIIHRDVKPSNLFLSKRRSGRITLKILDFGIAKASLTASDHQLTRTSALMGSPQYMSPEQLRESKSVDARTDIWSLGATMYEALTGAPVFPAETLAELHVKILMDEPTPSRSYRADAPEELDRILFRCLAKAQANRFASMQELQDALELLEKRLEAPREFFRSDPSFLETALPSTDRDAAYEDTGIGRTFGFQPAEAPPLPSPLSSRIAPKISGATLAASAAAVSRTIGGAKNLLAPTKKRAIAALSGVVLVASVLFKFLGGSAPSTPVPQASALNTTVKTAPAPAKAPAPEPSAPFVPPVWLLPAPTPTPIAAAAVVIAPAPDPLPVAPEKGEKSRKKRGAKGAVVGGATPPTPTPTPTLSVSVPSAPAPAKKASSSLNPELD